MRFPADVERELMREHFDHLPAAAQAAGFDAAMKNRAMVIALRRMVERGAYNRKRKEQ